MRKRLQGFRAIGQVFWLEKGDRLPARYPLYPWLMPVPGTASFRAQKSFKPLQVLPVDCQPGSDHSCERYGGYQAKRADQRPDYLFGHKGETDQIPIIPTSQGEHQQHRQRSSGVGQDQSVDSCCHVVLPERGYVRPGKVVVGTDSHTTSHGALGAFAFGIGATEMASVWALGSVLNVQVPGTIKVQVEGQFPERVGPKDLILEIIGRLSAEGGNFRVLEFHGAAIRKMSRR